MIKNKIVKYAKRKLSIGLCSVILGAMLIAQPSVTMHKSYAIEQQKKETIADKITPILPEDKVPVADKTKVDEDEITAIIYFIEEVNAHNFPEETTVKVEDGKVVITYPDKSVDTINVVDLVVETIGAKYKNLKNVNITPVLVKDNANLTEEEKEKAKQEIQKHIKDEAEYSVDKFGTVFVRFKDGTKCTVFGYR